jgi:cysteine-rich repeat protein
VEPGEQCDLGAANADRPAFVVTQSNLVFAVTPYAQVASSANFYDYVSASGHTGLEKLDTSLILLYLDRTATALSLIVEHGIDASTTSQQQPASKIQMLFSGLPAGCAVAVSDDAGELAMSSATTAAGRWSFKGNTDGGVLTGFPIPGSWEVLISPAFLSGITTWTWVQGSTSVVNLDLTVPIDIKAYASPSSCRTNCTIPRCGDGILDGGEVCDDGNNVNGDGCSSDCLSAQ